LWASAEIAVLLGPGVLHGTLVVPKGAPGIVVFAHGSGVAVGASGTAWSHAGSDMAGSILPQVKAPTLLIVGRDTSRFPSSS
jgi:hypothetical protein